MLSVRESPTMRLYLLVFHTMHAVLNKVML